MPRASILLLTCNGEKYLASLLRMIAQQTEKSFEVLAFDSESVDSTVRILEEFHVPTRSISRAQFTHPGTRNFAARVCSGKYAVFLTQDAVPANAVWLEALLDPFQSEADVAGVFSRQTPRNDDLLEASDIEAQFSSTFEIKRMTADQTPRRKELLESIRFSNSSAAYDRDLLIRNPFNDSLEMAEDQEWALRMLRQYAIVYQPSSVVIHSHEHSLSAKYKRSLVLGKSFSRFLGERFGPRSLILELGAWLGHVLKDFSYIGRTRASLLSKLKWTVLSPIHRAVTHFSFRSGWNSMARVLRTSPSKTTIRSST